jgi:methyl-accepting chemotaxis protein
MKFLSHMKLWQKLALLIVALLAPACAVGYLHLKKTHAEVETIRHELDGARYLQSLGAVLAELLNHRGRAHSLLNGDETRRPKVLESEADLDKLIVAMDAADAELGERFGSTAAWQAVKSAWADIKAKTLTASVSENLALHAQAVSRIFKLADIVAAKSGLAIDSQLDTSFLISLAIRDLPEMMERQGATRLYATGAALRARLEEADRSSIEMNATALHEMFDGAENRLQLTPLGADSTLGKVDAAINTAREEFSAFEQKLGANVLGVAHIEATGKTVYESGSTSTHSLIDLSAETYAVLVDTLNRRGAAAARIRNVSSAALLIALGAALALGMAITRSLTGPMSQAVAVFDRIAVGHYDSEIRLEGTDEISRVLLALSQMQDKLRKLKEDEANAAATTNGRVRAALDNVSSSVMVLDGNLQIIYVNPALERTFSGTQDEIRKALPHFDLAQLCGSSADVLTTEPNAQRRMLEALTGSDVREHQFGACIFRTIANPVVSERGERIGTVMEWTDRTQEVTTEREVQEMLSKVVQGNLCRRVDLRGKVGFFAAIGQAVNELADTMEQTVSRVMSAAAEISRGSKEIAMSSENLAQRTEQQSSSLEETASSMEEMTRTVMQNAENAASANRLAAAARDQAEKGGAAVTTTVNAMGAINRSSTRIVNIIGVIDEIAFQTNLLALNAAVEAARAGEQGRGFAVVASEVRSLAGRSAAAAQEIKDLIHTSVKEVADGSTLVTQSGQTLAEIITAVKKVSEIVAEIATASSEQSSGIAQVNRAIVQMDEVTQQNAALVEQATAAARAMSDQAQELNGMMQRYKLSTESGDALRAQGRGAAPSMRGRVSPKVAAI